VQFLFKPREVLSIQKDILNYLEKTVIQELLQKQKIKFILQKYQNISIFINKIAQNREMNGILTRIQTLGV
jgi:hypothetical protein